MKTWTLPAIAIAVVCTLLCIAASHATNYVDEYTYDTDVTGAFFCSDNVEDYGYFDDGTCNIVYDDIDAALEHCVIYVNPDTYFRIVNAKENGETIYGELQPSDWEIPGMEHTVAYTVIIDKDF